ncbi:MAG: TonB-dependent receptor, partial [Cytophagales bacterium]|nr:TonB-dependent receptor [Cytophagales bacterium]
SFKSNSDWARDYTTRLNADLQSGNFDLSSAHSDARSFADQGRYTPGTDAFNSQLNTIKNNNNWDINPVVNGKMVNIFPGASTTGGSALWQKSRIYHVEGQYDFSKYTKKYIDVLVGADYRTYEIIPDGNNFVDFSRPISERNVALSDGTYGKNVYYTKCGAFVQVSRQFFDNKLKAVASLRYDKNLEFEGKWNPRVALVYTPTQNHSIRASYQNGFRFPSLFEALSFVNNGGERRVGGLAEVNQGLGYLDNSYTKTSVDAFNTAVQADLNAGYSRQQAALRQGSLLQRSPISAIQPERINSFEIGYKGIYLDNKLSVDLDLYTNFYDNFINQVRVLVPTSGQIGGTDDLQTKYDMMSSSTRVAYRPYVNANQRYYSYGAALGLVYNFYQKYTVSGNVNYNNLISNDNPDVFIVAFNTPKWTYNISVGNREIVKNLGFNVVWRWQQAFQWQNIFADGTVPAYGTLDAQVTYKIPKAYSTIKVGANNLLNNHYIQYIGGPTIGAIYYVAVTVDGLLTNALVK